MPKTIVSADLYCYGNLVISGAWGGVALSLLLEQVGQEPTALSVSFSAQDGYKVTIPLERALQPEVIVAYEKDGALLSETFRLVVPGANGNIWIAMITSISLSLNAVQIEGQSASAGITPLERLQSTNLIKQELTQPAQEPAEQTTETKNETAVQPETQPPAETQPTQQQVTKQPEGAGFPAEIGFGMAIAATTAAVTVAAYLVYRRKTHSKQET